MELSEDLRQRLWRAERWDQALGLLASDALAQEDPWQRSALCFQVGLLFEGLLPDRLRAVELYERAWRATGDHRRALVRARFLARELGRLDLVARLLEIEAERFEESPLFLTAAQAFIDAGDPAHARTTLDKAAAARKGDRAVEALRRVVDGSAAEAPAEAEKLARQADTVNAGDPPAAAQLCLRAARLLIARAGDGAAGAALDLLDRAHTLDPRDDQAAMLLEGALGRAGAWVELEELARRRAARADSAFEAVDHLRRIGVAFVLRLGEPARGAALLEQALAHARDKGLRDVPAQIAIAWALRQGLEAAGQPGRFLEAVDSALAADVGDDVRVFLAAQGLEVARALGDESGARRCSADLARLVPSHPLFHKPVAPSPAAVAAAALLGTAPAAPRPEEPATPPPRKAPPPPPPSKASKGVAVAAAAPAAVAVAAPVAAPAAVAAPVAAAAAVAAPVAAAAPAPAPAPAAAPAPAPAPAAPPPAPRVAPPSPPAARPPTPPPAPPSSPRPPPPPAAATSGPQRRPPLPPPLPPPADTAPRRPPPPPPPPGGSRRTTERAAFHEAVVVNCSAEVEVRRLPGAGRPPATIQAAARDISVGGIFISTAATPPPLDEIVDLNVVVPGEEDWSLDTYAVKACVARHEPAGFGARFIDPPAALLTAIRGMVARAGR